MTKSLRAQANAALRAARTGSPGTLPDDNGGKRVVKVTVLPLHFKVTDEMKQELQRANAETRRALELPE